MSAVKLSATDRALYPERVTT